MGRSASSGTSAAGFGAPGAPHVIGPCPPRSVPTANEHQGHCWPWCLTGYPIFPNIAVRAVYVRTRTGTVISRLEDGISPCCPLSALFQEEVLSGILTVHALPRAPVVYTRTSDVRPRCTQEDVPYRHILTGTPPLGVRTRGGERHPGRGRIPCTPQQSSSSALLLDAHTVLDGARSGRVRGVPWCRVAGRKQGAVLGVNWRREL